MLNVPLEPDLEQRLHALAAKSGQSTIEIAREAIIEKLEDQDDIAAGESVLKNPGRRWTLEEIEAGLDLKADDVPGCIRRPRPACIPQAQSRDSG